MSYLVDAFLPTVEVPSPQGAKDFLIEGVYFDTPTITIVNAADGAFERMEVQYASGRHSMILRRLIGEDAAAARGVAIDRAIDDDRADIAKAITDSKVVLEWEIDRAELDEDASFGLRQWQTWIMSRAGGWLYTPDDGILDSDLFRA